MVESNNEDDDVTIAARSMITRLQGDFEGKTSCRDCLRSKTLPCSIVVEVADDATIFASVPSESSSSSLSLNIILRAHEILLRDYTQFLPTDDTTIIEGCSSISMPSSSSSYSSLACMNRISVILRFVQLLLLLSERQQQQQQQAQDNDNDPVQHSYQQAVSLPSAAEVNKMMESLLQAWTNGICEFLREWKNNKPGTENNNDDTIMDDDDDDANDDDDDDDDDDDPLTADATRNLRCGPVFCYAFSSLLRMNEYVQMRGALLVPLWKGLCDLAETLLMPPLSTEDNNDEKEDEDENEDNDKNDEWRKRLPPNLLGDAIGILGDFLREGKGRLEAVAVQRYLVPDNSTTSNNSDGNIAFQGKLVGFMVARMVHLMRVYFSFRCINNSQSNEVTEQQGTPLDDPLTNDVWRSLLGLRGMAMALQLLIEVSRSTESSLSKKVKDAEIGKDLSFLKVYCEIAAKAGICVTGIVLNSNRNKNQCRQQQQQKEQQYRIQILVPALESLLQSGMLAVDKDYKNRHDYQENHNPKVVQLRELGRALGKVSILHQILETANSACLIPGNIESLLGMIENLHSSSVPRCLSACVIAVRCSDTKKAGPNTSTTIPSTVILKSLQIMARSLREIESSNEFMTSSKQGSFYRLLVRWLAGADPDTGKQNPLSRDLILSLLQAHIVGNGTDYGGSKQNGVTKLLSHLTKLLMDPRTATLLRRNIAALLVRLQSSSTVNSDASALDLTKQLIEREFVTWVSKTTTDRLSKKRKRKRNGLPSSVGDLEEQDLLVISQVLSRQGMPNNFSVDAFPPVLRKEIVRLSSDCTDSSIKNVKALLALVDQNTLLFAWLERCMLGLSLQDFRRMTGLDLFLDIIQPVLSIISDIKFYPNDSVKLVKKKVTLYSAAMRLSTTAARLFGDDEKLPIEKICLLIQNSTSSKAWHEKENRSPVVKYHSILKFEVLFLLAVVGKAIPNVCPERALRVSGLHNGMARMRIFVFFLV
jgi:hypothetical protein